MDSAATGISAKLSVFHRGIQFKMNRSSRKKLRLNLLILSASLAIGMNAIVPTRAQSQDQNSPTLRETLRWIQTSLENGGGDVIVVEEHVAGSLRLEDFSSCKVHFTYSTHQEPIADGQLAPDRKPYQLDFFFSLGDIDPTTISFRRGFSASADAVAIHTRNDEKKITLRDPSEPNSLYDSIFGFPLDSTDANYVERFVKAFKHAVKLCGGKPSISADSDGQDSNKRVPRADRGATAQSAPPDEPIDLSAGMEPKETAASATKPARPRRDIPTIAKAANGAVVSIVMSDKDGKPLLQGSGFLVSKDGLIITNYHVISEGSSGIVKLPDGAFYIVDGVLAYDKNRDVAVIKANGQHFKTLPLGDSDRLRVGEDVVAIGNPLSLESTVSNGIVSGIRTSDELGGKFLQVTTPISHGSSGGPLLNMTGEVIGITTMYLRGGENLNFAIPINDAKALLRVDSSTIQAFPNETSPIDRSARPEPRSHPAGGDTGPSPGPETTPVTERQTDRDYFLQLYQAGGFSHEIGGTTWRVPDADYVCLSEDAYSGTFFTFTTRAYDEDYVKAGDLIAKLPASDEYWRQYGIQRTIQQKAPYLDFILDSQAFNDLSPDSQRFFRSGGRVLDEVVYEKGVEVNKLQYHWDGAMWFHPIPAPDPGAYSRTSKILHLSIEPTTMRYVESSEVTIAVGYGSTGVSDKTYHGPWAGTCEKIPDPNARK